MTNLETLFKAAAEKGASDVHLVAGLPPYFRIDGELVSTGKGDLSPKELETLIFSLLNQKQGEKFREERELDLSYESAQGTRFRVNLFWEKGNPALAARVISDKIPTLEELLMPAVTLDLLKMNSGLILLTGPTGCGKSTTLASMVEHINQNRACNIITLEDPIEFLFKPQKSIVRQRQSNTDFVSFEEALIHLLRQDPDVIMVGEMRSPETIATTITLAETGHLVLATLHTNSAAQTIDRIIDSFPAHQQNQIKLQLALCLKAVISQQLLPREGGGRVAAREVMLNNPAIGNLIRENKVNQIPNQIQTSGEMGMFTMSQDLQDLYKKKLISKETLENNQE